MVNWQEYRSCAIGFKWLPSLDPIHDIDPLFFTPNADDSTFQNDRDEKDEEQWSMYIHEDEEKDTDEEKWVDADGNTFDLFEIYEDWKYFTKALKQNTL